jgi:hypothetical protein
MTEAALPAWISRRLPNLKRTGKFSVPGDPQFDISSLSRPEVLGVLSITRHLDISGTHVTSLAGAPWFPHLKTFIADHTGITTFQNFQTVRTATTFSLRATPVSKLPTYKLSLLLAVGTSAVASIDGIKVPDKLRQRAAAFPAICSALVNRGWIATQEPPGDADIGRFCLAYNLRLPEAAPAVAERAAVVLENEEEQRGGQDDLPFEELLAKLKEEHEEVIRNGQAQFEVDEDEAPSEKAVEEDVPSERPRVEGSLKEPPAEEADGGEELQVPVV